VTGGRVVVTARWFAYGRAGAYQGMTANREKRPMIARRLFLLGAAGTAALAFVSMPRTGATPAQAFPVSYTDDEWRKRLTPAQYTVLRQAGTERPYSSPLNKEKRRGTFACAGCEQSLFASDTKFESGTGWPSFWAPLHNAVGTQDDRSFAMTRTSVHCSRCGGHLGHVFDDGPKPTGLRYCMNGVAMTFRPQPSSSPSSS
jgi:peptide-methionine (R)-S-oxide reductase